MAKQSTFFLKVILFIAMCSFSQKLLAASKSCTAFYTSEMGFRSRLYQPSIDDFRKNLFAVHVTDYFPKEGVLRAAYNKGLSMRPTVHFSLGEMVISHGSGAWNNKKMAILTPFSQMETQVINVFHQDTFVLGDLKLKKGSVLIVPENETIKDNIGELEVIRYNPQNISLSDKIRETLKEKNKWVFQATGGGDFDKVFFNGVEIDQKSFFNSVLNQYPYITFGLHAAHPMGKIDHFVSSNLGIFRSSSLYTERHYLDWILSLETIKMYLQQSDAVARKFKDKPEIYNVYESAKKRFQGKLNIIEAEIETQKQYRKTLLGSPNLPHDFLEYIKQISDNKDQLLHFLKENLSVLATFELDLKEAQKDAYSSFELFDLRNSLSLKKFKIMLESRPDIAEAVGGIKFQISLKEFDSTDSIKGKLKILRSSLSECLFAECQSWLYRLLDPHFQIDKNSILYDPRVSKNLSQFYDLKVFTELRPLDNSTKGWIWMSRAMFRSRNKDRLLKDAVQIYNFEKVK